MDAGTSGAKPTVSTPSAHLRVMWPRAIMTHNGAIHAVGEATARQLFFLTPARGVHSVQGKESWETHV